MEKFATKGISNVNPTKTAKRATFLYRDNLRLILKMSSAIESETTCFRQPVDGFNSSTVP